MRTVLEDHEVAACPECDAAAVQTRSSDLSHDVADRYRCGRCTATFDEFRARDRRGHSGLSGAARELLEADPDEVQR